VGGRKKGGSRLALPPYGNMVFYAVIFGQLGNLPVATAPEQTFFGSFFKKEHFLSSAPTRG
jgi:hypothetical protein